MLPIRDINPSRTVPYVNNALIALNVFFFLVQLVQGAHLDRFNYVYGLVPARYTVFHVSEYFTLSQQVFSFLSFMFLHGGFLHLLGNMWTLYIFGDNVEDHMGPFRYLIFYLLCGSVSGAAHMIFNTSSNVPVIGASGAISGVMGAYLLLFPRAKVLTLIPIIFIPLFVEIPAYVFLGVWFLFQFLSAAGSSGSSAGVAWWAHVGGFAAGMIFLRLFSRMPSTGFTHMTRQFSERKKSHRLQVLRPTGPMDDPNLYGTIVITPYEALSGAQKIVNIPWGFHHQMFRVTVPPSTREGNILRLQGIGKRMPDGQRGDVMLTVKIENPGGTP
jgi:hypothetical protein